MNNTSIKVGVGGVVSNCKLLISIKKIKQKALRRRKERAAMKKTLLVSGLVVSLFTAGGVMSQEIIKSWDKRFGGSGNDYALSIQQTIDGGYILAGYSYSGADGDKSEASRGSADYWLVKLDGNGNKSWDKRFGGSGNDIAYSIQQTSDGGYIVAGYSSSGADGDKTEASRGGWDYWVVKFGLSGNIVFSPANYNVSESSGVCDITIIRTNGSAGTGSVDFATIDGEAIAGVDYIATNGTLEWADGETNKVISISIINRHGVVGNRAFNVVLSNAVVIGLGSATNAVVEIVVNEPDVPNYISASKGVYTNKVVVSWAAVSDANGYEVWRGLADSTNEMAKIADVGSPVTNYNDTDAQGNVTYYYRVKAVNGAGASGFSGVDYGYRGVVGPLVYVDGKIGEVVVGAADEFSLAVEVMNIDEYIGIPVDWWLVAYIRSANAWYYLNSLMQWVSFSGDLGECHPGYQGGLMNTGVIPIMGGVVLPVGTYDVWFGVDYPMDGVLNISGPILYNHAVIVVE